MSNTLTKYILDVISDDNCVKISYSDSNSILSGNIFSQLTDKQLDERAEELGITIEELVAEITNIEKRIRQNHIPCQGDHYFLLLEMVRGNSIQ